MNEDFVSFSLAKKLMLKGFNAPCIAHYDEGFLRYNTKYPFALTAEELLISHNSRCTWIDAPTISQVLKWLRDSNAIHIHICLYSKGWYCDVYTFEYYEEDREYGVKHNVQFDEFSTYEEAALAGIEYALDIVI